MIVDTLQRAGDYSSLHPGLAAAFSWIAKTDLKSLAPGEHPIVEGVRAIVERYTTSREGDGKYEAHRKFIDIQCVASGEEAMLVRPLDSLETETSYDDGDDIIFLHPSGRGSRVTLTEGMFAVFFPQDAHMPGLATDAPTDVHKVVVKVAV